MTAEQEHSSLVKSGMFWEFFPELTGSWSDDEEVFTESINRLNGEYPDRVNIDCN